MTFQDLLDHLGEFDLILDADPKFPSITGLVTGAGVRGSWWAHPQAHEMFRLACRLRAHPDVLMVKLVSGKITLVNRPLWPAVYAVGTAREPWQMRALSAQAKALLKKIDKQGQSDATGDPVRELEARLLAYSESVHTERGAHSKHVETWESWAKRSGLGKAGITPAEGKVQLEQVVARLNKQFNARGTLPWVKGASVQIAARI